MKTNAESTSLSDGSIQSYVIIRGPQLYGQRTLLMNMIIFLIPLSVVVEWTSYENLIDKDQSINSMTMWTMWKKKFAELLLKHLVVFILLRIDT